MPGERLHMNNFTKTGSFKGFGRRWTWKMMSLPEVPKAIPPSSTSCVSFFSCANRAKVWPPKTPNNAARRNRRRTRRLALVFGDRGPVPGRPWNIWGFRLHYWGSLAHKRCFFLHVHIFPPHCQGLSCFRLLEPFGGLDSSRVNMLSEPWFEINPKKENSNRNWASLESLCPNVAIIYKYIQMLSNVMTC